MDSRSFNLGQRAQIQRVLLKINNSYLIANFQTPETPVLKKQRGKVDNKFL
jgi:hypothetical protein